MISAIKVVMTIAFLLLLGSYNQCFIVNSFFFLCAEYTEESSHSDSLLDFSAEALRSAIKELGHVTGKIGVEEILDVVFKDFCIGK